MGGTPCEKGATCVYLGMEESRREGRDETSLAVGGVLGEFGCKQELGKSVDGHAR